ncbi:N-acetylglucosamine 6-phosphate deacetylase [Cnuella takakiae]|uniref:N-acetylglucosamine 6-phosphate deacetylase n=1 Tax=Cnuella takakiae TaxID=1302690 RepID=A0A1M5F945_9BACT|nr:N-acetylglucosamine-6-phosphate deacetylase [Cnuella takakiae]OLY94625.1 N-acetylglucosamine-6-phosphate deacetylase [Cnuella takakiae]SHF88103.1 N-acetylglucosamine 6-phosphate deacetylase [Cnuella takakiae]
MPTIAYLPETLFTGKEFLSGHAVLVNDDTIEAILPATRLPAGTPVQHFPGATLAPAFIDIQIYGANKKLLAVHPTADALQDLYNYCAAGGAPLFQPTVATNTTEVFHHAIDAVRSYWQQGGKGCIGLHVEGPWISMEKRGAHLPQCVHAPTVEEAKALLEYGKGVITMITLAPEVCSPEVIALVQSYGVVVSAGHSSASFAQANQAFNEQGIGVATHMYNAMSALQHREPGLAGALMLHPSAMASIIPDGYHVDYAAIRIAKQLMGDRLFAITDAVTETSEGGYPHQLAGDKYESNGILSGSALTMHKAFVNLVQHCAIPVAEALRMCSLYPARVMKLDGQYGTIAPGCKANFVILEASLQLVATIAV